MRRLSCGVIVTDGAALLLGHATRSPRWDVPKGLCEPGEGLEAAARRELLEETGLVPPAGALRPLGTHAYLSGKDLCLFAWSPAPLPDPQALRCRSVFTTRTGEVLPEFDRFGVFAWDEAMARVGAGLRRVLGGLQDEASKRVLF